VLRRILGLKRDEVPGNGEKSNNEELSDLYSSHTSLRVIKSRIMGWSDHVARLGEVYTGFWWGNRRERDQWVDPGVDGKIMLRWIFR
jgi:hypothetical protein